jgi:hypothetical protein
MTAKIIPFPLERMRQPSLKPASSGRREIFFTDCDGAGQPDYGTPLGDGVPRKEPPT